MTNPTDQDINRFFAARLGKCTGCPPVVKGVCPTHNRDGQCHFFSPLTVAKDRDEVISWAMGQEWWNGGAETFLFMVYGLHRNNEVDMSDLRDIVSDILDFSIITKLHEFLTKEGK